MTFALSHHALASAAPVTPASFIRPRFAALKLRLVQAVSASFVAGMMLLAPMAANTPAFAQATEPFTTAQKSAIDEMIKAYLLKNPEVVQEAMVELERRQKEAELTARRTLTSNKAGPLFSSKHHFVIGNPQADVTIVEFFDFNCGYCKRGVSDLAKLLEADKNLQVVVKEFPILSNGSKEASAIALALRDQFTPQKQWDYHVKLLNNKGQNGKEQALALAKEMGADMAKLEKSMAAPEIADALDESRNLADALGITGTPSYVLGDDLVIGAVGVDALKQKISSLRKCGKTVCS